VLRCRDGVQSEEVAKLNTGADAGYRLIMHPSGRSLVCGMSVGGLERIDIQPGGAASDAPPTLTMSLGASPDCLLARFRQHSLTHCWLPTAAVCRGT
jgi:hypothetical protein